MANGVREDEVAAAGIEPLPWTGELPGNAAASNARTGEPWGRRQGCGRRGRVIDSRTPSITGTTGASSMDGMKTWIFA